MRLRNPTLLDLPSTEQLMVAPERALLAALDANLELAARLLMPEHVDLLPDGRRSRDPDYEPYTLDLLPKAEALIRGARRLRRHIAAYRATADSLFAYVDDFTSPPYDFDDPDDDIPF